LFGEKLNKKELPALQAGTFRIPVAVGKRGSCFFDFDSIAKNLNAPCGFCLLKQN